MKTVKKLICLLLCFLICFSLCSCNFLDEMREEQAFWGKDNTIIYKNKTYKKLSDCEFLSPEIDSEMYVKVTARDVPVMLSGVFGDSGEISIDRSIISIDSYNDSSFSYIPSYFAREDIYDTIQDKIFSLNYFDGYAFEYTDYNDDNKLGYEIVETKYKMISSDATETLDFLFNFGGEFLVDPEYIEQFYLTDIYKVSKDFNFKKNCGTLYNTPEGIYISIFDEYTGTKYIQISILYQDIFNQIVADFEKLDENKSINLDEDSSTYF